jgi:hypothetical protein
MIARWDTLQTAIINTTTNDTLYQYNGSGSQAFEPTLGAIKYMTDYTVIEPNKPAIFRKGTWELLSKSIY